MEMSHADKVMSRAEMLMDVCGLNFSLALKKASIEIRSEATTPEIIYKMADLIKLTDAIGIDRVALINHIHMESRRRFLFSEDCLQVEKTFRANQNARTVLKPLTFSDWKRVVTWTRIYCESQDKPFPHLAGDAGAWSKAHD